MNILCFGDSNTYGYKPDGTGRFDTDTRWTSLLQKKLGADHRVIEEGLCGRTTVFQDDLREGRRGLDLIGVTPARRSCQIGDQPLGPAFGGSFPTMGNL